jgi:hypothetical protein
MKERTRLLLFTAFLVIIATACKLVFAPKLAWSGFSPIFGVALFSGMMIKDKTISFVLPLIALFLSDVLIQVFYQLNLFPFAGFYSHQFINYGLLLLATLIGWALKGRNVGSLLAGTIAAPTVFFLLSNLGVWASSGAYQIYPKTAAGLLACYAAGLPFYEHSLVATLVFLPVVVIAYNLIVKRRPASVLA